MADEEDDLLATLLRDLALDLAAGDRDASALLHSDNFTFIADALNLDPATLRERLWRSWRVRFGEPLTLRHVCPCGEWRPRMFRRTWRGRPARYCRVCTEEFLAQKKG